MRSVRSISLGAVLIFAVMASTACGVPDGAAESTDAPATVTVTATPGGSETGSSPAQTPGGTTTRSPSASTQSADDTPVRGPSASPTDGAVLGEDVKGEDLTLSEFFQPAKDWTENRYDVAEENGVSGIAREITTCGTTDYTQPAALELRLANNFDKLTFKFGQDNQSASSKQTMVVRVVGNGNQIDIQRVPFNKVQEFDVEVTDINALEIEFSLDDDVSDCNQMGDSTAVIWDAELQ